MPMAGIDGDGYRPKVELERRIVGYPLAPPDPGIMVSLAAVRALASRSLAADRVVFGIGGAVSRDEVEEAVESATRGWEPSGRPAPETAVITPGESSSRFHAVDVPSLEGWIAIGRAVGGRSGIGSGLTGRFALHPRRAPQHRRARDAGPGQPGRLRDPGDGVRNGPSPRAHGRTPGGGRRPSSATAWTSWSASTIRTSR